MATLPSTLHTPPHILVTRELIELPLSSLGYRSSLSCVKALKGSCSWAVSAFQNPLHQSLAAAFLASWQVVFVPIFCSHPRLRSPFTLLPHFPLYFFSSLERDLRPAPLMLLNVSTLSTMWAQLLPKAVMVLAVIASRVTSGI